MAPVAQAQDAAAGQKKASMCIGCHGIPGYQASFPEVHKVPMISGQGAKYIASSLTAYKKGERKHPTMMAIAATLSEQDMADLGAFYEKHIKADMVKTVADTPAVRVYGPAAHPQPQGHEAHAFLGTAHITAGELIADRLLSPLEVQALQA